MIKLFTTHCPKCVILEKKMKSKNIDFETIDDQNKLIELGLKSFPAIEVDGNIMNYYDAVKYINNL